MKAAIAEIKSKGYWQMIIRPVTYKPDRIKDKLAIVDALDSINVSLRGWSYPHIDRQQAPIIEQTLVGQITHWTYFYECWMMIMSGQFFHVAGMRHDQGATVQTSPFTEIPAGTKVLGVGDTLFRMTEIVLFGTRFANMFAKGEGVDLELEVGGLEARHLVVDDPGRAGFDRYVSRSRTPFKRTIRLSEDASTEEVLATARKLAAELFELFGCRLADQVLAEWQSQIRRW